MERMRTPLLALLGVGLLVAVGKMAIAQGSDPNNVPYDPHPLKTPTLAGTAEPEQMIVDDKAVYVLKGGKVYRIPKSQFSIENVSSVDYAAAARN